MGRHSHAFGGMPPEVVHTVVGADDVAQVAVADHRQMAALMGGMNVALWMANRLRAYFAYFQRLPPALTTSNLQKALVALYAHLLQFLAEAIRTYSTHTAARVLQALWRESDLATFESRCDELGERADIEANNCDRELRANECAAAVHWRDGLNATLQKLDSIQSIQSSIDALHVKADLSKLLRAQEATYNSTAEEKLSLYLDGTRSELLRNITWWAEKPDGKLMFWLCGKAGTGKSTISRTIAQSFDKEQRLGASFFFQARRDEPKQCRPLFLHYRCAISGSGHAHASSHGSRA